MTEDEKYFHRNSDKDKISLETYKEWGRQNVKDIIACGFDPELTFIFSDLTYMGHMYENVVKVQRHTTYN